MSRLLLLLAFAGPGCAAEAVKLFRPTGAQSTHDLRYLPEDRYTGDTGARRDRELLLDIHVPATGKGPFPLLLTVHGGAWAAGAKENKPANEFTQAAIARGYAVAALNYILKPKEIVPQVFWDAQDSLRFLRQQAARFRIDPTRFGAIGWSAGGWLVSNLGFAGGDAVIHAHQGGGLLIADFAQGGKRGAKPWQLAEIGNPTGLAFPAWGATAVLAGPVRPGAGHQLRFLVLAWSGPAGRRRREPMGRRRLPQQGRAVGAESRRRLRLQRARGRGLEGQAGACAGDGFALHLGHGQRHRAADRTDPPVLRPSVRARRTRAGARDPALPAPRRGAHRGDDPGAGSRHRRPLHHRWQRPDAGGGPLCAAVHRAAGHDREGAGGADWNASPAASPRPASSPDRCRRASARRSRCACRRRP